jgi:hypothetical protein
VSVASLRPGRWKTLCSARNPGIRSEKKKKMFKKAKACTTDDSTIGSKRISYEQRRNVEATGQGSDGEGKKRKEKKRKGSHGNRVRLKRTKTIPVRASGEGEKEP